MKRANSSDEMMSAACGHRGKTTDGRGEPAELATLGCLLDQENEQENTRNKTRVEGGRFI
jgi:hypothetical protein